MRRILETTMSKEQRFPGGSLLSECCFLFPTPSVILKVTEDETRTQLLSIKKVTAEDLKRNYVCHARNAKGEVDRPANVKQKGNGCTQQMNV